MSEVGEDNSNSTTSVDIQLIFTPKALRALYGRRSIW